MPVVRTYECMDCSAVYEVTHESGDEPFPDCPNCSKVLEWRPQRFNTTTNKTKAVDLTQQVLEQDFGLTNYKDNLREGDVGYIAPTKTTAEKDVIMQRESEAGREVVQRMKQIDPQLKPQVDGFFGGQTAAIGNNRVPVTQLIQAGKMGPGAGVDPMAALHKLGKQGKLPQNYKIIARDKL